MEGIRNTLSIRIRRGLQMILRVWYVFPMDRKTVLIDSMWGKNDADNAGYYLRYVAKQGGDGLRYIWGLQHPGTQEGIPGVRFIRYKSPKWFYFYARAGVILYSHHLYNYLPIRKGQHHILMWHAGGAYKRIGQGVAGNSSTDAALHRYRNRRINSPGIIFLSSSEAFTRYNIREVYDFRGRIENTGMPRNDLFFDRDRVRKTAESVRKRLGVSGTATVALYAPTFRTAEIRKGGSTSGIDYGRLLKALDGEQGEEAVILYRCHYYERSRETENPRVIDVSAYPDMQELLCAADLLITDYSSCIWDYSFLERPCFLYVPDLEAYETKEQGFFTPIESWPGQICRNMEELCRDIRERREETFIRKAREHHRETGSYESGKACESLHHLVTSLTEQERV